MRFRPRHYVLLLILLALAAFNLWRSHRAQQFVPATTTLVIPAAGVSPTWPVYDKAALLRDAPDADFQLALKALATSVDAANPPQTPSDELADIHGCQTWLLFYRQEHLHPAINKPGWAEQVRHHVDICVAHHRDISL